jgi:hypothetical protein
VSKFNIPLRLSVLNPPAGVRMKVQRGRDELLDPTRQLKDRLIFDFPVTVDVGSGSPNFLGKYTHGPKTARFVYLNSGTYAGQTETCWSRRAKISLMGITAKQVRDLATMPGSRLEVSFEGTGGLDGGPVCGSIRSFVEGWTKIKE